MRFKSLGLAAAMAVSAALPLFAQQAPPPNWNPPSPIDFYAAAVGRVMAFDGWNALPAPQEYEFGYLMGAEGGLRYFNEPYYVTVAFEGYFIGHTEVDGRNGLGDFHNEEDFMMYGVCVRLGNGSINYNFGLVLAGGVIHLEERVTPPPGVILVGDPNQDNWYFRTGFFVERVLFGSEYGLRFWIGVDLDYTWTGNRDALGGKNLAWYGIAFRIFATY